MVAVAVTVAVAVLTAVRVTVAVGDAAGVAVRGRVAVAGGLAVADGGIAVAVAAAVAVEAGRVAHADRGGGGRGGVRARRLTGGGVGGGGRPVRWWTSAATGRWRSRRAVVRVAVADAASRSPSPVAGVRVWGMKTLIDESLPHAGREASERGDHRRCRRPDAPLAEPNFESRRSPLTPLVNRHRSPLRYALRAGSRCRCSQASRPPPWAQDSTRQLRSATCAAGAPAQVSRSTSSSGPAGRPSLLETTTRSA